MHNQPACGASGGAHTIFAPAECLLRRPQYTSRRMEFPVASIARQVTNASVANTTFVSSVYFSKYHVTKIIHFLNRPALGDTYCAEHAFFFSKALLHALKNHVSASVKHVLATFLHSIINKKKTLFRSLHRYAAYFLIVCANRAHLYGICSGTQHCVYRSINVWNHHAASWFSHLN